MELLFFIRTPDALEVTWDSLTCELDRVNIRLI